jgi:transposase
LRYGVKSEAISAAQLNLFHDNVDEDLAEIEQTIAPTPTQPRAPRAGSGRQPLPPHLPREDIIHDTPSCACGQCGAELVKFGEDVSEKLHIVPATYSVQRHIYPKYACKTCDSVVAASVPAAIIDSGMASNGLLTWVTVQKYLDHLPLYRLEQAAARQGVNLPRHTMAQWIGRIGVALQPLVDALRRRLLTDSALHADETPVGQLDPGSGKTNRSYLWAYRSVTGPPIVVFDYQTSRAGKHARQFLGDWHGHLMVDDYAGYKAMFNGNVVELACWAHARRKFHDLYQANQSNTAREALERIGKLYLVERDAADLTVEERLALRQTQSKPLLEELHAWLTSIATVGGTGLQKAIAYTLKRWPALIRYADSGVLPIDNNPVENAIRPIAIGKKNWLFVGTERAGIRAAAIQSLLATAKANGLDPHAWLLDTLDKLPTWPNSRIDELLPLSGVK